MKPLALITGVGPGTGSSLARRFAAAGYRTALIARDAARLARSLVAVANGAGCKTSALITDMDQALAPAAGPIDCHVALMSLPAVLQACPAPDGALISPAQFTLPRLAPSVHTPHERVLHWRDRLLARAGQLVAVGCACWSLLADHAVDWAGSGVL